jgi:hypothetical protein
MKKKAKCRFDQTPAERSFCRYFGIYRIAGIKEAACEDAF